MEIAAVNTYMSKERHRNLIFVEVVSETGICGWGEVYSVGPDEAAVATVKYFESWLRGMDPRNIEGIWQKLYNFSRFPGGIILMSAISGIEMALWDLAGKTLSQPVWRLLGGKCRDRIRAYGHVSGETSDEMVTNAQYMIERYGFSALKCFPLATKAPVLSTSGDPVLPPWPVMLKEADSKMKALRDALGDDTDIAVDLHASVKNLARSIEVCEILKPYRPLFVEEPLRPENMVDMANLARSVTVPVATGEMLYGKWQFRDLLERRAAHIIQPDICITGGLLETKKIAALAESFHVDLAPHNPMGPVATAANVHLCATVPNFLILEYMPDDTPERLDIVDEPVSFSDGWLVIPDRPGFGVNVMKDTLKQFPPITWHRPFRYYDDGSPAVI